ncbi:DUF3168 domain-containing protein [Paenibacillus sp. HJGM_3]|uniref:DUF3168 domain-containing protein n=1 Tax=Paenibacillus sp. HJGM_3 TaxID=3379816 RepID=UPI00385CE115
MSALLAIQTAIYARLTNDATLMAKLTGVHDEVPQDAAFPYVTLGESTSIPWRTQSRFGEEVTITLHIWSRYRGFKEALQILEDLNRLLADQVFAISGWEMSACYYEFSDTIRDDDGITRHVPVRYRLQLQKEGG